MPRRERHWGDVNAHREIRGLDVASGAGWLTFLRGLVARGLCGCTW